RTRGRVSGAAIGGGAGSEIASADIQARGRKSGNSPHRSHAKVPRPNQRIGIQVIAAPQYGHSRPMSGLKVPMSTVHPLTRLCSYVQSASRFTALFGGVTY